MPLIANTQLPTFERMKEEGHTVLTSDKALEQDIRELHIGLLNMMPDAAIEATERQFFRLIGGCNEIAQFFIHPFTLPELPRSEKAAAHIEKYYEDFNVLKEEGLDALIITGANVTQPDLAQESFWDPLNDVFDWASEHVTSVLCSCLATHANLQYRHGQKRRPLGFKRWGVYPHIVVDRGHPLVHDVNTLFDVPHSRFNEIGEDQFKAAGLHVLAQSKNAGVHLAVSEDLFRVVYFQGHPEYDMISLLKEYKREVTRYVQGFSSDYPPFPQHYFSRQTQAVLEEYKEQVISTAGSKKKLPEFPETWVMQNLHNTWHDTAAAIIDNWLGKIYQITNNDRKIPFMQYVDPDNPLGYRK